MHKISVKDISCFSYHGCMKEESIVGSNYLIDITLITDFKEASANDDLTKTIDYVDVNAIVKQEMAIPSKLIEHAGQRIVNRCKTELMSVQLVQLEIKKLNPPINGNVGYVSITIEE